MSILANEIPFKGSLTHLAHSLGSLHCEKVVMCNSCVFTLKMRLLSLVETHQSCVGNWQKSVSGCTPLANILSSIFHICTTNYMNPVLPGFFSVINLQRNIFFLSIFQIYIVFIHLPIPLNMIYFNQESIFSFSYLNCIDPLISLSCSHRANILNLM